MGAEGTDEIVVDQEQEEAPALNESDIVGASADDIEKLLAVPEDDAVDENEPEEDPAKEKPAEDDPAAEKPSEDPKPDEEKPAEEPDTVESLRAKLEASETRERDTLSRADRQATELGNLREVTDRRLARKEADPDDDDDPEAEEGFVTKKDVDDQVEAAIAKRDYDAHTASIDAAAERDKLKAAVPDLEDLKDTIVEIARGDGVQEEYIERFKQDPLSMPSNVVQHLAGRARDKQDVKAALARVESLETEIKTLKGESVEDITKKVNRAANEKPRVSAASTSAPSVLTLEDDSGVELAPTEDLDAMIDEGNLA